MPLRLLKVGAAVLSLGVLVISVGGYVLVQWFDSTVARVHLDLGRPAGAPAGSDVTPAAAPRGAENWLLVGVDSGRADVPGQRSDTTILVHLDGDGTTTNVSFPRDTLVTIPAYRDKAGLHEAHKDKFNAALSDGGPSLLVRTVQDMTGIGIDHYVSVDLAGFKKISQVLDGVTVCILPAPASAAEDYGQLTNINDGNSGFHGHYGTQKVAGDQALAFVRQRHGIPGGDLGRIARQQQFLGSVFRAATNNRVLFNPSAILHVVSAIKGAITLDTGTSVTDLEKLALRLKGVDPSKVSFETIPQRGLEFSDTDLGSVTPYQGLADGIPTLTPTGQTDNVGSVQVLERAPFEAMIAKLKDTVPPAAGSGSAAATPTTVPTPAGTSPDPTPTASTSAVTVPPSQVLVTVENGAGRSGLATEVTTALAKQGFRTGAPAADARFTYIASEVHYPPGAEESARTVAAAVPGAVLQPDSTVSGGVVLILGSDYTAVQPVSVDDASLTAPSSPSASSDPVTNDTVAPGDVTTPSSASETPTAIPPVVTAASPGNQCTY